MEGCHYFYTIPLIFIIISHIGLHTVYYDTCDLFSSTKLQIYYKEKQECVKAIISYESVMELNILLFKFAKPKIRHI